MDEVLPPYPHGPTRWYKQSRLGLYGGQRIQFGNNVGEKIAVKTRRTWHPNIFTRKLFSKSLNRPVQVRVSARVLRTIDKLGGLDEYLLGEKEARIKELGESGWWLRWAIMQTPSIKKRFREERKVLGISEEPEEVDTVAQGFEAFEAIEDSAEDMGPEEILEETESIPMTDDAFEVEQSADMPVIKFRVGPRKHVMLTADGWRRTRPDPQRWVDQKKKKIEEKFGDYVESRVSEFKQALDEKSANMGMAPMTDEERKPLIKNVRRELRAELNEQVEAIYQQRERSREARAEQRHAERKAAKKQKLQQASSEFPPGLEM